MTVKPNEPPAMDEGRIEAVNRVVTALDEDLESLSKTTREVQLPHGYKPWMRDEIIRRYREDGGWKHVSIHEDSGGKLYLSTRRKRRWHENGDLMRSLDNGMMNLTIGVFFGLIMLFALVGLITVFQKVFV